MLVPGVRVGPITAGAVRGDLGRLFPKGAVEDDEIELDEGMLQPATFVYRKDPSQTLAISWNGKGPQAHPKQIFVCHGLRRGPCRWHAAGGIAIGTRLSELETMNGGPFTRFGLRIQLRRQRALLGWRQARKARLQRKADADARWRADRRALYGRDDNGRGTRGPRRPADSLVDAGHAEAESARWSACCFSSPGRTARGAIRWSL